MAQPTIPGYSIIERIGSGGFASVYLATEDANGRNVAIKVLHDHTSNPSDLRRFERERTTMRALNGHPNIVAIYDSGTTDDDGHYTVLEYISGGSVRDRISQGGALHWAATVEIGVQICAALDAAHRNGVLHRDVKPGNILLEDNSAKLGDFGIARLIGQSQVTAAQSIIGTLAYTPPELFHNKPFDGRGDIYQLGVTLYEMLLGRAPFTSAAADNKATVIRRILDNPAPPLAQFDVPQTLSDLLDRVLAKDPADRPQTAESLARQLNDVERSLGRTPTTVSDPTQSLDMATTTLPGAADTGEVAPATTNDTSWPQAAVLPDADFTQSKPAASSASVSDLAAQSLTEQTPAPPVVAPPPDANMTVVEPRPADDTSLLATGSGSGSGSGGPNMSLGTAGPAPAHFERETPSPTEAEKPSRSRLPWFLLALGLIGAAVAGVIIARMTAPDGESAETVPSGDVVTDNDETATEAQQFVPLDEIAFAQPEAEHGVIFDAVRNSEGLTMVGSAGEGESTSDQSPVVWTLDVDESRMQRAFESTGRLWSIGVIDREDFLAVGDTEGAGETDGLAFIGDRAATLEETTATTFTGNARDVLRTAVADPATGSSAFLVGGSQSSDGVATLGIWSVARPADGQAPRWIAEPVGNGERGTINAVAANESIAVAVGFERQDGADAGVFLIRRDDGWSDLIRPFPNTVFHAVTIADDRLIAVGETGEDPESRTPVAIVASADGAGWFHQLPVRTDTGTARDIVQLEDGRVVVVGDAAGNSADERLGAIWELLPNTDLSGDQWTTRASADLATDGFTELRTIAEYEGTVYVFGRTQTDGRRPAGAWTLDLDA